MLDNQPLCCKVIDRVDHKQRVSLCSFVDQPRKLCWKSIDGKSNGQILGNGFIAKVFNRQFLALLLGQQLLLDCLEGMPTHNQLHNPICPDQHKPCGLTLPCQVGDQVKRRVVAPVKVLQYEHQRQVCRQHLQSFAHLPQHSLTCRPGQFSTQ